MERSMKYFNHYEKWLLHHGLFASLIAFVISIIMVFMGNFMFAIISLVTLVHIGMTAHYTEILDKKAYMLNISYVTIRPIYMMLFLAYTDYRSALLAHNNVISMFNETYGTVANLSAPVFTDFLIGRFLVLIIVLLLWSIPNAIYFTKRKYIFEIER